MGSNASNAQTALVVNNTSRTALETYERCPAERFWGYEVAKGMPITDEATGETTYHPGGLSPIRKSIYLVTGGAFHEGVAELLRWCRDHGTEAMATTHGVPLEVLEKAVAATLAFFWREAGECGSGLDPADDATAPSQTTEDSPEARALAAELGLESTDDFARRKVEWIAKEQAGIAEGMVRAFVVGGELRRLLERYEVVEVEREGAFHLTNSKCSHCEGTGGEDFISGHCPDCNSTGVGGKVVFQYRPDALLRDRLDSSLYVWSAKTAGQWGWLNAERHKVDVQGLSEAVGLEQEWAAAREQKHQPFEYDFPQVHAIQMHHFIKGRREHDDRKGWKVTYCRWTRGWKSVQEEITGRVTSYAWKWNWEDASGKKRALSGAKWSPFYAWEEFAGGVGEWMRMLASGKVQPEAGDPFAADSSWVVVPEPYFRQPHDFEEWLWSARAKEARIAEDAAVLNAIAITGEGEGGGMGGERFRRELSERFPKTRASCIRYGGKCAFYELCHGARHHSEAPLNSGLWGLRVPHHEVRGDE